MEKINVLNVRYIVFLIDSKIKDHDGKIFTSYNDAKDYVKSVINSYYSDKAVIGMFLLNQNLKEMNISHIDSIGFKNDKKDINQLSLFKK